jgi:hypothetical protein
MRISELLDSGACRWIWDGRRGGGASGGRVKVVFACGGAEVASGIRAPVALGKRGRTTDPRLSPAKPIRRTRVASAWFPRELVWSSGPARGLTGETELPRERSPTPHIFSFFFSFFFFSSQHNFLSTSYAYNSSVKNAYNSSFKKKLHAQLV